MSYRIKYDTESNKRYPENKIRKPVHLKSIFLVMLALVVILVMIQYNLIYYILPGDPVVTMNAAEGLIEDIRDGDPVKKAINCFIETVLNDES